MSGLPNTIEGSHLRAAVTHIFVVLLLLSAVASLANIGRRLTAVSDKVTTAMSIYARYYTRDFTI